MLFQHDILIYAVIPLAFFLQWVLFSTRWGLSIRTVGEDKTVAYAAGLRTKWLQYQAIFVGGLLAGLGGAHLSLAFTGVWGEQMTSGRGFIAVALVIFAAWSPLRAVLGALLYSAFWLALLLAFAVTAAWLVQHDDPDQEEPQPEWREGPNGFGLYDKSDWRIDPHVTDDD